MQALSLAPPPAPRPFRARRSLRLIRALIRDPEQTDLVFELIDAMGGRGDEPLFESFVTSAGGRRLLAERPALVAALADREVLSGLPAESFGRAYLDFVLARGFEADGLQQANERGLGAVNAELDPERRWFYERLTVMHDLWHVLTGYETDEAGEAALLAFSLAQGIASRGIRLIIAAAAWNGPWGGGFGFQRMLLAAWRRGRRSTPLVEARYEELLPLPLASVRQLLQIPPLASAHPRGLVHAGFARAPA